MRTKLDRLGLYWISRERRYGPANYSGSRTGTPPRSCFRNAFFILVVNLWTTFPRVCLDQEDEEDEAEAAGQKKVVRWVSPPSSNPLPPSSTPLPRPTPSLIQLPPSSNPLPHLIPSLIQSPPSSHPLPHPIPSLIQSPPSPHLPTLFFHPVPSPSAPPPFPPVFFLCQTNSYHLLGHPLSLRSPPYHNTMSCLTMSLPASSVPLPCLRALSYNTVWSLAASSIPYMASLCPSIICKNLMKFLFHTATLVVQFMYEKHLSHISSLASFLKLQ